MPALLLPGVVVFCPHIITRYSTVNVDGAYLGVLSRVYKARHNDRFDTVIGYCETSKL